MFYFTCNHGLSVDDVQITLAAFCTNACYQLVDNHFVQGADIRLKTKETFCRMEVSSVKGFVARFLLYPSKTAYVRGLFVTLAKPSIEWSNYSP